MAWFRGDDRLHSHRKTRAVLKTHPDKRRDVSPMGLWILAGTWASQNATTGWVPEEELDRFDDDWEDLASRLVDAGFWWPEKRNREGGFGFVNWEEYNPSAGQPSESGTYGNHVRWHVTRNKIADDCPHCPTEPTPDIAPDVTPDEPNLSGANRVRVAPRSGAESQSIALPNPIPTHTQPIPNPLVRENESDDDGNELALVLVRATADAVAPTTKTTTTKGTRLADGWVPARTNANLKAEAGHESAWLSRELERFRDHFTAAAGARGVKVNWDATWRNWLKTAEDRAPRTNGRPRTAAAMSDIDWSIHMQNAIAADDADRSAS